MPGFPYLNVRVLQIMCEHGILRLVLVVCGGGGGLLPWNKVADMKRTDQARLNEEYQRLVNGLAESGFGRSSGGVGGSNGLAGGTGGGEDISAAADAIPANPALPADILQEAVPGNIRRAEHFVSFLRKVGNKRGLF